MKNPNIMLIVMDAVRAQNMSVYGYERETTPFLRKILPHCVLYKNAISSSYWTLPSFASIFTGTHVSRHGLVMDGDVLDKKFITMAEVLRDSGYNTIGLCASPYVSEFSGLHRGFEIFRNPEDASLRLRLYTSLRTLDHLLNTSMLHTLEEGIGIATEKDPQKRWHLFSTAFNSIRELGVVKRALWKLSGVFDKYAKATNDLTFKLIERVKGGPFFMFIHTCETHAPYVLPKSFRERFLASVMEKKPWDVNQDYFKYYSEEAKMGKLDFHVLKAFYDGAICYSDTRIFEIFRFLRKRRLWNNTMVIFTSDHGDCFGEHGIMSHNFCLYDTLIKIPLIIKYPVDMHLSGIENRIVQNTDLLPTIIDILKLENEVVRTRKLLEQIQGNSLVSSNIIGRNDGYAVSELVKPFGPRMQPLEDKLQKYKRRLISIRTENKKYIHASDGNHELYDLQNDPNETINLIDSQDSDITKLMEKLEPFLIAFHDCCKDIELQKKEGKFARAKLSRKDREKIEDRLKQLGYL